MFGPFGRLVFLALSLIYFLRGSPATAADRIKIGVSTALSGGAASYGTDVRNGIVFANELLGDEKYELVIEDDKCSDREAVTIANKFAHVDKVKYVLGFGCSGAMLASAPVYEKAKMVVIGSGAGAPQISGAGDYIFRTKPSLSIAASLLGRDVSKKHKKVGVVTEETAYCQGLTDAFTKEAAARGVEVINHNFTPHTDDFQTILLRLKASGVEAVFLNPQTESTLVTMFRQLRNMGWPVAVYGNFHPGFPLFLQTFGAQGDGVVFADVAFNDQYLDDEGMQLVTAFEAKHGKPLSTEHFVTLSMLALRALHEAIKSGKDVKEFLYQHRFRELTKGEYSFDKNGDVKSDTVTYVLKTIKGGVPVPYIGTP